MILAASVAFSSAQAQPLCTDRADVVKNLKSQYSESPIGMGITNAGGVLELLTSEDGRTWTIILTMPDGVTCMIGAGTNWEERAKGEPL